MKDGKKLIKMIWNRDSKKNQENFTIYAYEIAGTYTSQLANITPKQLIRMGERWRCDIDMAWNIDWQRVNIDRKQLSRLNNTEYLTVLKLGTFHGNGYYRQKCMEALASYEGTLSFLMLRLNDWVSPIRESAFALVQKRLETCQILELFEALPMFAKVKDSRRRSNEHVLQIEKQIQLILSSKISDMPIDEIHTYDVNIKNAIYRIVNKSRILDADSMKRLLVLEKTGYGKTLLIRGILQHYECDEEQIQQYLQSKSPIVRYYALTYRYEKQGNIWAGIEAMLMDKSRRIRDFVSYLLKGHSDFSILDFYKNKLEEKVTGIAILGISEHGSRQEIALIKPFLEVEDEHIAAAALQAYGRLAAQEGEELYWKYLFDCRQMISTRAYRMIRKFNICYGAAALYQAYLEQKNTQIGHYLLNLLLKEPSWERLPFVLRLYGKENLPEAIKNALQGAICTRNMYARISAKQAQEIRDLLQEKADIIPESIRKGIEFDLKYVIG